MAAKKKSGKLGGGGRFAKGVKALKAKGKSADQAKGIMAAAGREKWGSDKMAEMASAGKRKKHS